MEVRSYFISSYLYIDNNIILLLELLEWIIILSQSKIINYVKGKRYNML